ncbi:MAG: WD40 repeat domain-containing protein [Elainellaceae cyanobacterium]
MHSISAMLLRYFTGWAVLVAIAPFSSVSANANPISEVGSEPLSPSAGLIQSEISVVESAQQIDAARLERQGFLALQRFEAGEQLAALRLALQAGEQLSDRVSLGQPLTDYPALILVLALQTILDTIHEAHQIQLTQPLETLSQSPDGAVLATLGRGEGIQLWDWSGQLRHTLSGQYGMSFSANGAYIAAITIDDDQNSTIHVWDVATGEQVTQFQEDSFVFRVALSPDGQRIFTQRIESSTLELWNLSGQQIGQIDHQHFIDRILVSPDGQWFATRSGDQAVSLWTMAGAEIARLETITSLDFSPDGSHLFIAQDSGVIQRINQAGVMQPVILQTAAVRQIQVSPTGDRIAVITDAGRVELLDITGESIAELPGSNVYFSPDGAWVITTTDDGTVWFRDPIAQFNAQLVGEFENPSIHFNDDSSRMLIVDQDTAQLWNIAGTRGIRDGAGVLTEADLRKLTEFAIVTSSSQNAPILSPDLARIATVRSPQTISLWTVNSPSDRFKLPLPYDRYC